MTESANAATRHPCRICLSNKKTLCPLFRYKLSGNYAEMLTAIADVKVGTKYFDAITPAPTILMCYLFISLISISLFVLETATYK